MKLRKTPLNERKTYTYLFDEETESGVLVSRKMVLEAGKNGVTAEDIDRLHKLDDLEVYNNNKNRKSPMTDLLKDEISVWEESHEGERFTGRHNISLDYFCDCEDDNAQDKGLAAMIAYTPSHFEETDKAELIATYLDFLTPLQIEVFYSIVVDGEKQVEIAERLGTSKPNINKIYMTAVKKVKDHYKDIPDPRR